MLIHYVAIVLGGFLLGIFFISQLKKFSLSYNLLIPKGIPLIGGLGMGSSFILVALPSFFLYSGLSKQLVGVIVSSTIMLVFGVIDDWQELSVRAKFLIQIITTSLLIVFGIRTQIVYIGNLFNIIITFIWILAITNAFNHLDIMDGLASGTALTVSFSFFVISLLNGDIKTIILTLSLIGAILSFLIYNLPPAKIYLGNTGSHFLGFILAAIALVVSYAPLERKIALLSPLLILGLPIFDTAFLILMRIKKGKLIFRKSNDHLALRFLSRGYSKKKSLLFMLLLGLFFSLSGVVFSQVANPLGIIMVIFVALVSLIIAFRMSKIAVNG